jgi:hypothetical protein
MKGVGFVVEPGHVWCVFSYETQECRLYRLSSEDGITWDTPECIDEVLHGEHILITPQGEIGIIDHEYYPGLIILYTSPDWRKWKKALIFESKEGIEGVIITTGESRDLWGFMESGEKVMLIESIPP